MNTIKTKSYFSPFGVRFILLTALLVSNLSLMAYDFEVGGIYYNAIDDINVCVTYKDKNYNSYADWVFVPDSWQGSGNRNIIGIGECAFKDCSHVGVVNIKNNILFIDSCAFQNCNIEHIYIPSSITRIGNHAFEGCTSLNDVRFYGDILNIPDGMFKGCTSLKAINFPNSLMSIGDEAFMGSGFKQLTMGGALTTIGDSAFADCVNFTRLIILAGSEPLTIGYNAFAGSTLATITCEDTIPPVLTNGIGLTPEQLKTVKLIIPKSTYEAYSQADYWKEFEHIEEPNYDFSTIHSGKEIYYKIIGDEEVCITYKDANYNSYQGNYVEEEYDWYEEGAIDKNQRWNSMGIPDEVTYNGKTYRVTAIGENAFRGCTSINKIDWVRSKYLKHIGANAFKGCSNLKYLTLPSKLETIAAHAFEGCSYIHVVSIPGSVNSIDTCAFMGCSRLKTITLNSLSQIGPKAFSGTKLRGHILTGGIGVYCTTVIPPVLADSTVFDPVHYANSIVKVLFSRADLYRNTKNWEYFENIRSLPYDFGAKNSDNETIYYRINNEHEVGVSPADEVYYGTYGYGDYNIPETVNYNGKTYRVTSIEYKAFYFSQCSRVNVPKSVKRISDLAFGSCFVEHLNLGDSVETIGVGAFNGSQITSIHFPRSVKAIGDSALFNTPELRTITVEDGNPVYDSRDSCNALIETATNRLIAGGGYCTEIPSTVTSITDYAFYGKSRLGHITIPGSIRRVSNYAFFACGNLSQVTLSEGIKCIGGGAFCFTGLNSVVIPNSVDTIEEAAFEVSNKIKSVVLGSGLKYLGSRAFSKGSNAGLTSAIDTVICYTVMPPQMAATCFAGAYNRATLLVPLESITLYKADTNWSRFHKIRAIGVPEMPGDVNFDYEVNIADVNSLVNIILGGTDNSDGLSDVNGDGEINIADINVVINYILGSQ